MRRQPRTVNKHQLHYSSLQMVRVVAHTSSFGCRLVAIVSWATLNILQFHLLTRGDPGPESLTSFDFEFHLLNRRGRSCQTSLELGAASEYAAACTVR